MSDATYYAGLGTGAECDQTTFVILVTERRRFYCSACFDRIETSEKLTVVTLHEVAR